MTIHSVLILGMGTIKAHTNWSMVTPEKAATLTELIFNIFFAKLAPASFDVLGH